MFGCSRPDEDPALGVEALDAGIRDPSSPPDHLERDAPLESSRRFGPRGRPPPCRRARARRGSRTARSAPGTARRPRAGSPESQALAAERRPTRPGPRRRCREERLDLVAQRRVAAAGRGDERGRAPAAGLSSGVEIDRLGPAEELRRHGTPAISRWSQASACFHSRLTVACETLEDLGRLLDRESREEAQLDEARLALVERRELQERPVEVEEVEVALRRRDLARLRRARRAPGPRRAARSRRARAWSTSTCRIARAATPKKWARSFQSTRRAADELQVGLVDEGGRLERVARALAPQVTRRRAGGARRRREAGACRAPSGPRRSTPEGDA